jgi:hypothetical protein
MIYKIYIDENNLFIAQDANYFKDCFGWTNKSIVYDTGIKRDCIYCDEEHLEKCKKKLLKSLIKEQADIVKEANSKLQTLKQIIL